MAQTERACSLIDALLALPLAAQDQYLVLRLSLQHRVDHLTLTVSWTLLQDHVDRLQATLVDAEYSPMHRPPAEGSPENDQLALPLHHGGFRFRSMTAQVAVAAQLSAVALTRGVLVLEHDRPGGRSCPTVSGSLDAGSHEARPERVPSLRQPQSPCHNLESRHTKNARFVIVSSYILQHNMIYARCC
jgi:hypothetical protein